MAVELGLTIEEILKILAIKSDVDKAIADKALKSVRVIAGAGLQGGGTLEADRQINVGKGNGINVGVDNISAKAGAGITVDSNGINVKYGTTANTACEGDDQNPDLPEEQISVSSVSLSSLTGIDLKTRTKTTIPLNDDIYKIVSFSRMEMIEEVTPV